MKRKLLRVALITSPILAIYGIAPVILFNDIPIADPLLGFISLAVLIFLFWIINIYLFERSISLIEKYALSFLLTLLLHSIIIYFFYENFEKQLNHANFIIYPLTATIAIDSIILVMINLEQAKHKHYLAEWELQDLKIKSIEAQKQVLIQQLQPHFLFNSLSILKSLIREDPELATEYSVKLSDFLRYSIHSHSNELVTLEDELKFTLDYLELQKVRFGESFQCEIQIPDASMNNKIPVFALQTLLENAIKHNAFSRNRPLIIKIDFKDGKISVSNNKSARRTEHSTGTGLLNLNSRYKLIANHPIEIKNSNDLFCVTLTLIHP